MALARTVPFLPSLAIALLAAATSAQTRDARLFESPFVGFDTSDFFTARYVYASCVADLDRDGDPDAAAVTWPSIPRLSVVRNAGAGMFAAPDLYPLPFASQEVIPADLDGDGHVDLIASNTGQNQDGIGVSWFQGRGDGTFFPGVTFPTARGPEGIAAADFDGDGNLDLAVAEWGALGRGTTVAILRNTGGAQGPLLAPPVAYPAGDGPFDVCASDLDRDGDLDLAVANGWPNVGGTARLNLLFNDGAGGFATRVELSGFFAGISFFPTVVAPDLDLDGDPDLLYSDAHTAGLIVFENQGNGTFGAPVTFAPTVFSGGPNALAVGDVTGDGWPDVVGTQQSNQGWTLWPSLGGGDLGTAKRFAAGEAAYDIDLADADGDGDLDPIIAARDSLEISVHWNPGDGEFALPRGTAVSPAGFFDHGDIDADGDLDIASAAGSIEILRNRGDGTFPPVERLLLPSPAGDVKLRDLDSDGDLDLLWNEAAPPYRWGRALNDGTGRFGNILIVPVATCGYFASEIDAFDLDDDGDLDVVQIESLGCGTVGGRVFVNENTGNAQFRLANVIQPFPNPRSVAGGDFDHDGIIDLALTSQPTTILLGNGDFTFEQFGAGIVPGINIATDDFDHDGHLDLAIALQRNVNPWIESMVIQLGFGDGEFRPPVTYLGSHSPNLAQISEILTGDADGDGNADVMCLNYASNDMSLWLGNGDGTFQRQVRYGAGVGSNDFAWADFDGDGTADVATYDRSFPPISHALQIIAGALDVPHCQPNLGFHGPGTAFFSACGQALATGGSTNLLMVHAPASTPAVVGIGLAAAPIPLLGGAWVPNPAVLVVPVVTDAQGAWSLDIPGGGGPVDLVLQLAYLDAATPFGVGLTNAVELQVLP
jgi:hypothetical protein